MTTVYDFALVENTRAPKGQNPIVAGISLQKNLGYFGKVKLTFGVLEIVATHPGKREMNEHLMRCKCTRLPLPWLTLGLMQTYLAL